MGEKSKYDRRQFMGAAAMTVAATQLRASRNAGATSKRIKSPLSGTSLGPVKQVQAGLLNVGYVEAGPVNGTPVVLLHGWPYDINAFVDVAPLLASKGFRVIVPYLRGYGSTRFLSNDTFRNGQPSAVALDTIALMDALKIDKAIVAGFDWGARTANIIAALWPERVKAMVSVSGYLIGSQEAGRMPLPPAAELQWWYQYYFATERGRQDTKNIGMTSRSSFGDSLLRNGASMMLRSIAALRLSTIRIRSRSLYIIIAGGSDWLMAKANMTNLKNGLLRLQ